MKTYTRDIYLNNGIILTDQFRALSKDVWMNVFFLSKHSRNLLALGAWEEEVVETD